MSPPPRRRLDLPQIPSAKNLRRQPISAIAQIKTAAIAGGRFKIVDRVEEK